MQQNQLTRVLRLWATSNGKQFVSLHISDNGSGIAEDIIDHIFVPFYSTKKSGSGIGLSIAYQIMQKQRGNLSVSSTVGKGSTFTMSFIQYAGTASAMSANGHAQ